MMLTLCFSWAALAAEPLPEISRVGPNRYVVNGAAVSWGEAGPLLARVPAAAPSVKRAQALGTVSNLTLAVGVASLTSATVLRLSPSNCHTSRVIPEICGEQRAQLTAGLGLGGTVLTGVVSLPLRRSSVRRRHAAVELYTTAMPPAVEPAAPPPPADDTPTPSPSTFDEPIEDPLDG